MSHPKNVYHSVESQAGYIGSVSPQQHQPVTSDRPTCPYEACVIPDSSASRLAAMMLLRFMKNETINKTQFQFECPLDRCMKNFTEPMKLIEHLRDCPELCKGFFKCKECEIGHNFPTTERGWLEFSGWDTITEKKKRSSLTEKLKVMVRSSPKPSSPRSFKSSSDSCISPSTQSKASSTPSSEFSAGSPYEIVERNESEIQWRHSPHDAWGMVMPTSEQPSQVSTRHQAGQQLQDEPIVQIPQPQELWDTGRARIELPDNQSLSTTRATYKAHAPPPPYHGDALWHIQSAPPYPNVQANGTWFSALGEQFASHAARRGMQQSSTDSHASSNGSFGLLQTKIAPTFSHNLSESPGGLEVGHIGPITELPAGEFSSSHSGSYDSISLSFVGGDVGAVASVRTNFNSRNNTGSFDCVSVGSWAPNGDPIFSTFDPENDGGHAILMALQEIDGSAPPGSQETCDFDHGPRREWLPEMEAVPVMSRSAAVVEPSGEAEDDTSLMCEHVDCNFRPSGTKLHNYRKYLHKHRETHRRARYECDRCESVYTRSDNLKKHRREKHGIEETRGYGATRMSSQYRRSSRIAAAGEDGLGRLDTLRVSKCPRR